VGRIIAAAVLLFVVGRAAIATGGAVQARIDAAEVAQYRLTDDVFLRFQSASRAIGSTTRADPVFARDPLFTRDVIVAADVRSAAAALETRLQKHPSIVDALQQAKLSARDYTKFALALFAARLAHGFVKTGVLRRVPEGVASDNVAFVERHDAEITALLAGLGIDG
jgi:hypothetical protein